MKKINVLKKIAATLAAATMMITAICVSASAENKAYVISGDEFRTAYSATGADTKDYVTFKQLGSYELQFNFELNSGIIKTYTALSPKMKGITAYIPMQDMLDKLKITAADVKCITITGPSYDNVEKMSFTLNGTSNASASSAAAPAGNSTTSSPVISKEAGSGDQNPSTGVDDIVLPLTIAGAFGLVSTAAFITRKRFK